MPYALRRPRLWYERRGAGEPLLLITGFTISSAVFEPVLDLYSGRFEVITYDNRLSGRSEAPRVPTSMPQLAADAAHLLDALGVGSAHVYGLSMGGMIAQELALRFPEKVRGLVLGGTSAGGPRALRPALNEAAALAFGAAVGWTDPSRTWLAEWVFSREFRDEQPERTRELLRFFGKHRAPLYGAAGHLWASIYHDTFSRLGHIKAPTLVMHGAKDAMAPIGNARILAERIPDAELAIVPRSGHAFMLERPQESFDLFCDWLDRRSPIAAGPPNTGPLARAEPLTRALGLQIGALRTGASLVAHGVDRLTGRRHGADDPEERNEGHVEAHRRAA